MIFSLLLSVFLLLDVAVGQAPTQRCTDAQTAINANQECTQAVQRISQEASDNQIPLNSDLQEYCTPTCRSLNARLISACEVRKTISSLVLCSYTLCFLLLPALHMYNLCMHDQH